MDKNDFFLVVVNRILHNHWADLDTFQTTKSGQYLSTNTRGKKRGMKEQPKQEDSTVHFHSSHHSPFYPSLPQAEANKIEKLLATEYTVNVQVCFL